MQENISGETIAAVFVGGSEVPIERIAARALAELHEGGPGSEQAAERLNILWSAIDVAGFLTTHNWRVMTGGYKMGNLGMANKAAEVISQKLGGIAPPLGVVFSDWFPNDPLEIKSQTYKARDLSERQGIYFEKAKAFFLMGGGGLGTLSEIFASFKDDAMRDEVVRFSTPGKDEDLSLRPYIVVDPTERIHALFQATFNGYFDPQRRSSDPILLGLLDRVYLIGKEGFRTINNPQYPGLLRLSEDSKNNIGQILDHFQGLNTALPPVKTLTNYLAQK